MIYLICKKKTMNIYQLKLVFSSNIFRLCLLIKKLNKIDIYYFKKKKKKTDNRDKTKQKKKK